MKLLILDCETTGLEPQQDKVVEIGLVTYETENKRILEARNFQIYREEVSLTEEITSITGLNDNNLLSGVSPRDAAVILLGYIGSCDYIVGQNLNKFDLPFIEGLLAEKDSVLPKIDTIDTRTDLPLKYKPRSYALQSLLADHEKLNYFSHCALGDALMTLKLLMEYDINEVIEMANSPLLTIQAKVSYDDRQLAKEKGFFWDGESKRWLLDIKQCQYNSQDFKFKTVIVGG